MNIIWNENELNKIQLILRRFNIKINENNELVFHNYTGYFNESTIREKNELKQLFNYQNKNDVLNILNQINKTKQLVDNDKNNPLYYGMISNISNINQDDCSGVFIIFKEIIFQYSRIIGNLSRKIVETLKDPLIISEKIDEIKNSNIKTKEELYIENYINSIFDNIEYIRDSEVFKPIINNLNNSIKQRLIDCLETNKNKILLQEKNRNDSNLKDYFSNVAKKIAKKRNLNFCEYR